MKARLQGLLRVVFRLSQPSFSDATEPRPFWYGCEKLDNSMSWRTPEGDAGLKESRSGGVNRDRTVWFSVAASGRTADLSWAGFDRLVVDPRLPLVGKVWSSAVLGGATSKMVAGSRSVALTALIDLGGAIAGRLGAKGAFEGRRQRAAAILPATMAASSPTPMRSDDFRLRRKWTPTK